MPLRQDQLIGADVGGVIVAARTDHGLPNTCAVGRQDTVDAVERGSAIGRQQRLILSAGEAGRHRLLHVLQNLRRKLNLSLIAPGVDLRHLLRVEPHRAEGSLAG